MATHHNRKPVYERESSPLDPNVTDLASHVYQWKETGAKPDDVSLGNNAWMPPFENAGDIVVWCDSNTLGYPTIPNAPMFWSDGGLGQSKILQMINHCSYRKSGITFSDYNDAKTWILAQPDIYTNLTDALEYILGPGGNQTLTIVNNTTRPLVRIQIKQTTISEDTFHAEGYTAVGSELAEWLPIQPGASIKLYGIQATTAHHGPAIGTTAKIGIDVYWDQTETKTIDTVVNGIPGIPSNSTSTSYNNIFSAARAGSTTGEISLQPGDDVTVTFTS